MTNHLHVKEFGITYEALPILDPCIRKWVLGYMHKYLSKSVLNKY